MRVIAGSARRIQLDTLDTQETRPTLDRQKETLFNVVQFDLIDAKCLDLFAGSGALGIEALSRGAAKAYFVEQNAAAFEIIKENLNRTKLKEKSVVLLGDALSTLPKLKNETFDLIFLDPPYGQNLEKHAIRQIMDLNLLSDGGTIIVETSLETDLRDCLVNPLTIWNEKSFKTNKLSFIGKKDE